jgi:chromosome segregation ATPase
MSEERLERIENQLAQVLQAIISTNSRIDDLETSLTSLDRRIAAVEQNQEALREDVGSLRQRIDSVEGTLRLAIADGFRSQDLYYDDLNADLARNERQTRRLSRRVDRLERRNEE